MVKNKRASSVALFTREVAKKPQNFYGIFATLFGTFTPYQRHTHAVISTCMGCVRCRSAPNGRQSFAKIFRVTGGEFSWAEAVILRTRVFNFNPAHERTHADASAPVPALSHSEQQSAAERIAAAGGIYGRAGIHAGNAHGFAVVIQIRAFAAASYDERIYLGRQLG